jgi:membrane protease YdiL (CAAX protease family)
MEAIGIIALCFGWFILGSAYAVSAGFRSGVFSESGMLQLVGLEVFLGGMAILILRSRGFDIASLYPHPSWTGIGLGVLVAIVAALAGSAAMAPFSYSQYSEPLERLMGGSPIGLSTLVLLGLVNGTYEEIFLLGFLLRGLRGYGLSIALGVSLLVRVLYHLYQGPLGAMYVGAFGLVLSLYYVSSGRLFPVVFAHALWDILPFMAHSP